MDNVLNWIQSNLAIVILGSVTLVQISPIKINPWSWIAKQIRSALVGDLEKEVKGLAQDFIE